MIINAEPIAEVYILNVMSCVHLCTKLYSHVRTSENDKKFNLGTAVAHIWK